MKGFQRPAGATRNNVRVTEQAFSTVTGYAVTHNLDKIVVVSSLLEAYLPKDPAKTAEYLLREPRKGVRNRDLTYVEYSALTERFNEVCATHGLPRAVIVENLILHQLPAVAKIYPPRRQFRRRGA
jgi:hypothetical protein